MPDNPTHGIICRQISKSRRWIKRGENKNTQKCMHETYCNKIRWPMCKAMCHPFNFTRYMATVNYWGCYRISMDIRQMPFQDLQWIREIIN